MVTSTARLIAILTSLAFILFSGCARVTTDYYVHEATDAIRCGQYHSAHYQDASDAFPKELDGIILVPEFARQVGQRCSGQLRGSFFIVARDYHELEFSSIEVSSPDKNVIHNLDVDLTAKLTEIKPSNLWQDKVHLKIPADLFTGAETLAVTVTWKDSTTGKQNQSILNLEREQRRRFVFPT